MPDSIGHHRRCNAGREVKVSTAYLGGLAVSDKQGTVVTSANTTRTTGRTARSPMRVILCAKKTLSCFTQCSMNIVCKVLVYSDKSIAWQSLTNSHYQVLEVEIVRLDLSVGQGVVKIEIENEV